MNKKIDDPNFASTFFLVESNEELKIKGGASSDSNVLNRFFKKLTADSTLITTRLNHLASRVDRVLSILSVQAGSMLTELQQISARVDAASGYSQILTSLHNSTYVDTVNSNCNINYTFGQATLPIRSTTDLLTNTDVYGTIYVAPVEFAWATGLTPDLLQYSTDPAAIQMLMQDQAWIFTQAASGETCWVNIKVPVQYKNLNPNVLELWPLPPFGVALLQVSYQLAGDSFSSTWYDLDLSYLPFYSGGFVTKMAPVRLHLPNRQISQIRIKLQTLDGTAVGFKSIKLQHNEYDTTGTLIVQDPYARTVSSPILKGKDPADLSQLLVTTNSNTATINLSTTDAGQTPVITAAILAV